MLGYVCKYTPIEIFESMGVQMERIEPEVTSFTQADMKMHPNICSFAKGVLEEALKGEYEGIILTTCCDSIRRLYSLEWKIRSLKTAADLRIRRGITRRQGMWRSCPEN